MTPRFYNIALIPLAIFFADAAQAMEGQSLSEGSKKASGLEFRVEAEMGFLPAIDDYRAQSIEIGDGTRPFAARPAPLKIQESTFRFGHIFWRGEATRELGLNLTLPFRSAQGQASELGGYRLGLESRFDQLRLSLAFADRQSAQLKLFERHADLEAALSFITEEDLGRLRLSLEAGPEVARPLAASLVGADMNYGLLWGGQTQLRLRWPGALGPQSGLALGTGLAFFRLDGNQSGDFTESGAGLLSTSVELAYSPMAGLWTKLKFEHPLFRPEGREGTLARSDLPGLYGNSWRFALSYAIR